MRVFGILWISESCRSDPKNSVRVVKLCAKRGNARNEILRRWWLQGMKMGELKEVERNAGGGRYCEKKERRKMKESGRDVRAPGARASRPLSIR